MSKDIKLIAIDIDNTVLCEESNDISLVNRQAIQSAKDAGVMVTLATGRMYANTRHWVERLDLDAPIISSNGAEIRQNHASLFTEYLEDAMIPDIVDAAKKANADVFIFTGDHVYFTPDDENEHAFNHWYKDGKAPSFLRPQQSYEDIYALVSGVAQKVLLLADNDQHHQQMMQSLSHLEDVAHIVTGAALNLELTKKGTSKGAALRRIAELNHFSEDEVVAMGDNGNDISMLECAKNSVAVDNALPEVKKVAHYITDSCQNNGVAKAINYFLFNKGNLHRNN